MPQQRNRMGPGRTPSAEETAGGLEQLRRRRAAAPGALEALRALWDAGAGALRGATVATLGAAGDIESLLREVSDRSYDAAFGEKGTRTEVGDAYYKKQSVLPNSDDFNRWLPDSKAGKTGAPLEKITSVVGLPITPRAVTGVALGTQELGRQTGKMAAAAAHRAMQSEGGLGQMLTAGARPAYAVRPKGGNFDDLSMKGQLAFEGVDVPEMEGFTPTRLPATSTWANKQLTNYLRKDLGSPTDPLLQVEKDGALHFNDNDQWAPTNWQVHEAQNDYDYVLRHLRDARVGDISLEEHFKRSFPDDAEAKLMNNLKSTLGDNRVRNYNYLKRHYELSKDAPLTPWGYFSDHRLKSMNPEQFLNSFDTQNFMRSHVDVDSPDGSNLLPSRDFPPEHSVRKKLEWAENAPANTQIWRLRSGEPLNELGFNRVLDFLDQAQQPYKTFRDALPPEVADEMIAAIGRGETPPGVPQDFADQVRPWIQGGHALKPEDLSNLGVAEAVRKYSKYRDWWESEQAREKLSKGLQEQPFLALPDETKWVEIGPRPWEPPVYTLDNLKDHGFELRERVHPFDEDKVTLDDLHYQDDVEGYNAAMQKLFAELDYYHGYGSADKARQAFMELGDHYASMNWLKENFPQRHLHANERRIQRAIARIGEEDGLMTSWSAGKVEDLLPALRHVNTHPDLSNVSAGLKAEGEYMGHCVGGYCEPVMDGRTRILSLRDKRGMPHATVELNREKLPNWWADDNFMDRDRGLGKFFDEYSSDGGGQLYESYRTAFPEWMKVNHPDIYAMHKDRFEGKEAWGPVTINQVKGKGNAEPVAKYRQHVNALVKHLQESGNLDMSELPYDLDRLGYKTWRGKWYSDEAEASAAAQQEVAPVLEAINKEFPDLVANWNTVKEDAWNNNTPMGRLFYGSTNVFRGKDSTSGYTLGEVMEMLHNPTGHHTARRLWDHLDELLPQLRQMELKPEEVDEWSEFAKKAVQYLRNDLGVDDPYRRGNFVRYLADQRFANLGARAALERANRFLDDNYPDLFDYNGDMRYGYLRPMRRWEDEQRAARLPAVPGRARTLEELTAAEGDELHRMLQAEGGNFEEALYNMTQRFGIDIEDLREAALQGHWAAAFGPVQPGHAAPRQGGWDGLGPRAPRQEDPNVLEGRDLVREVNEAPRVRFDDPNNPDNRAALRAQRQADLRRDPEHNARVDEAEYMLANPDNAFPQGQPMLAHRPAIVTYFRNQGLPDLDALHMFEALQRLPLADHARANDYIEHLMGVFGGRGEVHFEDALNSAKERLLRNGNMNAEQAEETVFRIAAEEGWYRAFDGDGNLLRHEYDDDIPFAEGGVVPNRGLESLFAAAIRSRRGA